MLKKLLGYINENHWQSIFFTGKFHEYSRLKYQLTNNGIETKTKFVNNRERSGIGTIGGSGNEYYEICVHSKDVERANEIIHNQ